MATTTGVLAREVFDANGRRLVLRGSGRSGGEGTVYDVEGRPLSLAKIYHPQRVTAELQRKIAAMQASPPQDVSWDAQRHRSIAWAEGSVFHDAGRQRFAGFLMPRIDTRTFREAHLYFDPQDRVRAFGGGFTWRHLLAAATNIASAVAAIHAQGHRIGDLRETNVLIGPTALIALIDCDSFQIRDPANGAIFYSRVGTADYLPPELHGADFGDDHDRTHADLFALGVLVFKLLMEGVHPYQARGARVDDAPSTEAKIKRGLFPYERAWGVEPPPFAPPYPNVPPSLRKLFKRCFVEGHRRPSRRPSASEWFRALKEEGKKVRGCAVNPNHRFGGHLRSCPWCASSLDPFPAPGTLGKQVAVPAAPPARAARVTATPPAPSVSAPQAPPSAPRRRLTRGFLWVWRRARSVRITKRRAAWTLGLAVLLGALVSPLGHASPPPVRTKIALNTSLTGPCPFDPQQMHAADRSCRARWTIGPAAQIEERSRRLFLLKDSSKTLEVGFKVRFEGTNCTVPWIDHLAFNERAAPVCLGVCPERIELRGAGGTTYRLIGSRGVAAASGPLACGKTYVGTWTFDGNDARAPLRVHYPGFKDVVIRGAA